jgi:DNA-binding response OmpR family regulator
MQQPAGGSQPGSRPRILVIGDDADLAGFVVQILATEADVHVAHGVRQALAHWEQRRPDLLVIDLQLTGDADGLDVYQEIRRRLGARPAAIVVSGTYHAEAAARAIGVAVVRKPFSLDELLDRVRRALNEGPTARSSMM